MKSLLIAGLATLTVTLTAASVSAFDHDYHGGGRFGFGNNAGCNSGFGGGPGYGYQHSGWGSQSGYGQSFSGNPWRPGPSLYGQNGTAGWNPGLNHWNTGYRPVPNRIVPHGNHLHVQPWGYVGTNYGSKNWIAY